MNVWTEYNSKTGEIGGVHSGYETEAEVLAQLFLPGMDSVMPGYFSGDTYRVADGAAVKKS